MTLMTKGEFASHRGVGKSAVSNWAKKDLLVMGECPETGAIKVDVERTDARINARVDPMRGRPTSGAPAPAVATTKEGGDHTSLAREAAYVRTEVAKENLIGQRLKNAVGARELAPLIELERRASELGRVARERMHSMFRALSERLAAERDVRTIMALGGAEIDRVFSELAAEVEGGMLAATVDDEPDDAAVENAVAEAELAEA
jgi:hypothetical protein